MVWQGENNVYGDMGNSAKGAGYGANYCDYSHGWYHRAYYHLMWACFDLRAAMVLPRTCVGCELPAMIDLWRRLWRAEPSALFGVATLAAVSNTVCCDDYVDRHVHHTALI